MSNSGAKRLILSKEITYTQEKIPDVQRVRGFTDFAVDLKYMLINVSHYNCCFPI
jgi:hypothetical protein